MILHRIVVFAVSIVAAATLLQPVYAGQWEVTVTTTNSKNPTSAPLSGTPLAIAESVKAMASATVIATGTTTGTVSGTAQAAYSGTWTFRWIPSSSSDWPSAYTIKQVKTRMYTAHLANATGTARSFITGGADQALITLPSSPTATFSLPAPTQSTDTSVPNLTVKTTIVDSSHTSALSGGWSQTKQAVTIVERSYTAAYFTSNFSAPADVVLTFTLESQDISASLSYSSSSSSGGGAANAVATEFFSGQ
jgi:hypothetical protein